MSESSSFAEKFRPTKVSQLIGKTQKEIAQGLLDSIANKTFRRETMIIGPSGVGKTTIIRMCANALGISEADMETINCGDDTGVDRIRDFIRSMQFAPMVGDWSVYYLDEIHNLTKNAQEALLTEIEPVPPHVVLFASTTDDAKLLKTLKRRFDKYYLTSPDEKDFKIKAGWICDLYKKKLSPDLLDEIIAISAGCVGDFDRYIQQALEGTFKGNALNEQDPESLVGVLFYQTPTVPKLFAAAAKETEYIGSAVGLCNYCIKVLNNPRPQPEIFKRAQVVLSIMGDGLGRDMPAKVVFHKKLLEICAELTGR